MDTITWVGIDHYVDKDSLVEFYNNLKEGDVVTLVLEPENFWDNRAIAVFHKFIMRGHISRHETGPVHIMAENNVDMVGRITDDIDPELNQVKLTIDSVRATCDNDNNRPVLAPSAIGMDITPHIMYEEYSYCQIKNAIENMARTIKMNDIESILVGVNVKEIISAVEVYLTIWEKSISFEANRLPRYFDEILTNLSSLSQAIKIQLRSVLKRLRVCTAMQSKTEHNVKVFVEQMKTLEKFYSLEDGFYSLYDKAFGDNHEKMKERIEEIRGWLEKLSADGRCHYTDFNAFVHMIYYNGYRAQELYMIITHLLVLRHLALKVDNLPCDISVEKMIVNGTLNVFGTMNNIHDNNFNN